MIHDTSNPEWYLAHGQLTLLSRTAALQFTALSPSSHSPISFSTLLPFVFVTLFCICQLGLVNQIVNRWTNHIGNDCGRMLGSFGAVLGLLGMALYMCRSNIFLLFHAQFTLSGPRWGHRVALPTTQISNVCCGLLLGMYESLSNIACHRFLLYSPDFTLPYLCSHEWPSLTLFGPVIQYVWEPFQRHRCRLSPSLIILYRFHHFPLSFSYLSNHI